VRAARNDALEILITPSYGAYNSRIKRIAPDTDSAETNKAVTVAPLTRAKRPKLMKREVSQKIRIARIGMDIKVDYSS
jgi:hypothetical protein